LGGNGYLLSRESHRRSYSFAAVCIPSLPLNRIGRRFVVDLQAQIFESDGLMPTVYPPQFFDLEFTRKFVVVKRMAVSGAIEIYRIIAARA
jgi:hypothetical protein